MHPKRNRRTLSRQNSIHPKSNRATMVIRPTPSNSDRRLSRFRQPTCFGRTCHYPEPLSDCVESEPDSDGVDSLDGEPSETELSLTSDEW